MKNNALKLSAIALIFSVTNPVFANPEQNERRVETDQVRLGINLLNAMAGGLMVLDNVMSSINPGVDVDVDVAEPNSFSQSNSGAVRSNLLVVNAKTHFNGKVIANNSALGNNISVEIENSSPVDLSDITQDNSGPVLANAVLNVNQRRAPKVIKLNNTALGNNFSLDANNTAALNVGVTQSNSGTVRANTVQFGGVNPLSRPGLTKKITVDNTALGNNISISNEGGN